MIPLECEYFSLRGVALLQDTIHKVTGAHSTPTSSSTGVLGTMFDPHGARPRGAGAVVEAFGDKVFHTVIRAP